MQLTQLAHQYLEAQLSRGDLAIDATSGNGHDTLKMATLVGESGKVIAIDIQSAAILATKKRIQESAHSNVEFIESDHASALLILSKEYPGKVSAITFNLGYLPGSNKHIQTEPISTLKALDAAAELLAPRGMLLVTAYRGHTGGLEEASAVEDWMLRRRAEALSVESHEPQATQIPPILWVLQQSTLAQNVVHQNPPT